MHRIRIKLDHDLHAAFSRRGVSQYARLMIAQAQQLRNQAKILTLLGQSQAAFISIIEDEHMAFELADDSDGKNLKLTITNRKGKPAPVDGVPQWSVSDPAILTVEPSADGMTAVVKPVGPLGTAQVVVTADSAFGESVSTITGTNDVTVVAGPAVAISVDLAE